MGYGQGHNTTRDRVRPEVGHGLVYGATRVWILVTILPLQQVYFQEMFSMLSQIIAGKKCMVAVELERFKAVMFIAKVVTSTPAPPPLSWEGR